MALPMSHDANQIIQNRFVVYQTDFERLALRLIDFLSNIIFAIRYLYSKTIYHKSKAISMEWDIGHLLFTLKKNKTFPSQATFE